MDQVLGFEVDQPSEFSIKTSNTVEYIKSDVQTLRHQEKMTLSSSIFEKNIHDSFERVLKAI